MKKVFLITCSLFFTFCAIGQKGEGDQKKKEKKDKPVEVGQFQLGMRSTVSLFDHQAYPGLGYGAQFRLRPSKRLNTEWYLDYIKTDISGLGQRETAHIGWSVMFYPFNAEVKKGSITPYIIGGHCFDYAKVTSNSYFVPLSTSPIQNSVKRWSTAVQMGMGANFYISDKVDLSLSGQYMSHIGNELHVDVLNHHGEEVGYDDAGENHLIINEEPSKVLEGHLLLTLSMNIRIADFSK